jgi:hypothetical protein
VQRPGTAASYAHSVALTCDGQNEHPSVSGGDAHKTPLAPGDIPPGGHVHHNENDPIGPNAGAAAAAGPAPAGPAAPPLPPNGHADIHHLPPIVAPARPAAH